MQCFRASFHHSRQAVFNTEKANIWLFVFVKTFYGFVSCAVWLFLYAEADRVLSRPACLSVCALATELFLQVQKSLLHCAAAQPFNQALFLFCGSQAKGRSPELSCKSVLLVQQSKKKKRSRVHVSDCKRLTFLQQSYFSSVDVNFIRREQTFPSLFHLCFKFWPSSTPWTNIHTAWDNEKCRKPPSYFTWGWHLFLAISSWLVQNVAEEEVPVVFFH